MNRHLTLLTLTAMAMAASAAAPAAEDASMARDLKATIALQGKPCDEIVSSTRTADSDYVAVCKDGNRYRVFVDSKGRVVVEKQ